jgi:hypothetical protein
MDQQTMLSKQLLALQETVRAVASEGGKPSSVIVEHINYVFAAINSLVSGAHFAMFKTYTDPSPIEVLGQIKLALDILGHDLASVTDQVAEDESMQRGQLVSQSRRRNWKSSSAARSKG